MREIKSIVSVLLPERDGDDLPEPEAGQLKQCVAVGFILVVDDRRHDLAQLLGGAAEVMQ